MKKLLIPIDGTEKSLDSFKIAKDLYSPKDFDVHLLYVMENIENSYVRDYYDKNKDKYIEMLNDNAKKLSDYKITTSVGFGVPGEEIINYVKTHKIDIVVMTKATKYGLAKHIGSVTTYVVKHSPCTVTIVPEKV